MPGTWFASALAMPSADASHPAPLPAADTAPLRPHLLDASMFCSPAGGVARMLSAKQALLGAAGWRHTVMAPGLHGPERIDCGGLPLPASGGDRFVTRRAQAARLMQAARPDIVEAADPGTLAWAALDATAQLQVPAVAFCHSNLPAIAARLVGGKAGLHSRRGAWAADQAAAYLARLYARFDLVLAPSRAMVQTVRSWGIEHVVHQPLGVDCTVFRPRAKDMLWRLRIRERLQLPISSRLLVYCGRFGPEKNLQVLVDALRLLGRGHALLALGAGPCPPRGEHVRVLAPETDSRRLARLLASCDVFVHPGEHEPFGQAALEAMACGTPVVVNAAAGLGELARGVGITVASLRPREWAEAIAAGIADDASSRVWQALQHARAHDWPLVLAQWLQRYRALQHLRHERPERHARDAGGPLPAEAQSGPSALSI